jgi:hypothetical protein
MRPTDPPTSHIHRRILANGVADRAAVRRAAAARFAGAAWGCGSPAGMSCRKMLPFCDGRFFGIATTAAATRPPAAAGLRRGAFAAHPTRLGKIARQIAPAES